jgi:hypothetical protein
MATLTSKTLHENQPATSLDWAGNPMPRDGSYGGRPEHMHPSDKPLSQERLSVMRQRMAKAREALARKRERKRQRRTASSTAPTTP